MAKRPNIPQKGRVFSKGKTLLLFALLLKLQRVSRILLPLRPAGVLTCHVPFTASLNRLTEHHLSCCTVRFLDLAVQRYPARLVKAGERTGCCHQMILVFSSWGVKNRQFFCWNPKSFPERSIATFPINKSNDRITYF